MSSPPDNNNSNIPISFSNLTSAKTPNPYQSSNSSSSISNISEPIGTIYNHVQFDINHYLRVTQKIVVLGIQLELKKIKIIYQPNQRIQL
jgi:hypothetical protein